PMVVSLSILLEVPGAALLAAVFLGQVPPPAALPALALVLAGLAVVIRTRAPEEPAAVPVE
ncbi:MAG: EamA family transporter, partial [Actinomycetota bacterium]|nr:EamA family transporter [Actinomycetota bacterium]